MESRGSAVAIETKYEQEDEYILIGSSCSKKKPSPINTQKDCWFHGRITREDAALLVSDSERPDGVFLVRESCSRPGTFVLTVRGRKEVYHVELVSHGDGFFSVGADQIFQGLDRLIHYYQNRDELPAKLASTFVIGSSFPVSIPASLMNQAKTSRLHKAVASNNVPEVQSILTSSPSLTEGTVNSQNVFGQTPVHEVAKNGFVEVMKLLLEQKPDLSLSDSKGATALHWAACYNHSEVIKLLVENSNADLHKRNSITGWVALHEASIRGNIESVKCLLQLNAALRPRTIDDHKDTPRDLAVRYKQPAVVKLLDWAANNYPKPRTTTSEWLHKNRNSAEELLLKKCSVDESNDGIFLVTPNSRKPAYYTLRLVYNQRVYDYDIICQYDRWYYIGNGPLFDSLSSCIEHYMMFADGLHTILRCPVPPSGQKAKPLKSGPSPGEVLFSQPFHPSSLPTLPAFSAADTTVYVQRELLELGEEKLGCGVFGPVLKGMYRTHEGKIDVAVKTISYSIMTHNEKEFLREAHIMVSLDHPCIVKLIGVTPTNPLMLILELVQYGSLVDYLQKECYPRPGKLTLKLWAAEIASGMVYLEAKKFVHRDLAARNILVASPTQVKISDFGLSRAVGANSDYYRASHSGRWPFKWYAPESIYYGFFSHAGDVWSYGVTLWEMFSYGDTPYGDMTAAEVLAFMENHDGRLGCPMDCPHSIYKLMLECWSMEPHDRPTFQQLHLFFNEST